MRIVLEAPDVKRIGPMYVGDRRRLATVTSVAFVGDDHLVAAHLLGCTLFLIKYDVESLTTKRTRVSDGDGAAAATCDLATQTHSIVDTIQTTYGGKPVITDLLDYEPITKQIVVSNFDGESGTLYRLIDTADGACRLEHVRDLPIPKQYRGKCHGAKFYDPNTACLTSRQAQALVFIDTETAKCKCVLRLTVTPQDVAFVDKTHALVISNLSRSPTRGEHKPYVAALVYYEIDVDGARATELHRITFDDSHFDSVVVDGQRSESAYKSMEERSDDSAYAADSAKRSERRALSIQRQRVSVRVYMTNQYRDVVNVVDLIDNTLVKRTELTGYSFPHGLSVAPSGTGDMLAVTNYGTSSIMLSPLQ